MMSDKMRDVLLENLKYEDGSLIWKRTIGSRAKAGAVVGSKDRHGYLRFWMNRKQYSVHRAIFLMHHGFLPDVIDHINGVVNDNRIENLREATISQNLFNQKCRQLSISGVKGVHWHTKNQRWTASIGHEGRLIHLGSFLSIDDAAKARHQKAAELHGEFFNPGVKVAP